VIYPGSTERTSFAEADETKGYCRLVFGPASDGGWALARNEFVPLPTRPMVTVELPTRLAPDGVARFLGEVARKAPPDAIVRFTSSEPVSPTLRRAFGTRRLADCLPPSMNVQFGSGFFDPRAPEVRL
jgi:hypothetical protein